MLARFSIRTLSSSICRPFRLFSVAPQTEENPEADETLEPTEKRISRGRTKKVVRARHFLKKRAPRPTSEEADHIRSLYRSRKIDFQDTELSLETPEYWPLTKP